MIIWLIAQMPDLKQVKLSAGMRDQFCFWCQGREGEFDSIEAALLNNWIVKGNGAALTQSLNRWKLNDRGLPIVYTTIGGHHIFEMCAIPQSIRTERIFGVSAPPTAPVFASTNLSDPWSE